MNIILVSDNLAKGRVIAVGQSQLLLLAVAAFVLLLALGSVLYSFTLRYAVDVKFPHLESISSSLYRQEAAKKESLMRDNINAFAAKLGEMQARLMRLDAFGARLVREVGVKAQEFDFTEPPGRGGALPATTRPARPA